MENVWWILSLCHLVVMVFSNCWLTISDNGTSFFCPVFPLAYKRLSWWYWTESRQGNKKKPNWYSLISSSQHVSNRGSMNNEQSMTLEPALQPADCRRHSRALLAQTQRKPTSLQNEKHCKLIAAQPSSLSPTSKRSIVGKMLLVARNIKDNLRDPRCHLCCRWCD